MSSSTSSSEPARRARAGAFAIGGCLLFTLLGLEVLSRVVLVQASRDLRRFGCCGRNNARPRQESTRQIDQHEAKKKRSISNCTNENEHGHGCDPWSGTSSKSARPAKDFES